MEKSRPVTQWGKEMKRHSPEWVTGMKAPKTRVPAPSSLTIFVAERHSCVGGSRGGHLTQPADLLLATNQI